MSQSIQLSTQSQQQQNKIKQNEKPLQILQINQIVEEQLSNFKQYVNFYQNLSHFDLIYYILNSKLTKLELPTDFQINDKQFDQIQEIKSRISQSVKFFINPKNLDEQKMAQLDDYLTNLNEICKSRLLIKFESIFFNKNVVKQINKLIKTFHNRNDINGKAPIQGFTKKIYGIQKITKLMLQIQDSQTQQSSKIKSLFYSTFKIQTQIPLFGLSSDEYIQSYFLVDQIEKVPKGFIQKFQKYLQKQLTNYKSLIKFMKDNLVKRKKASNTHNLEEVFSQIYSTLTKSVKFQINPNDFKSIFLSSLWIQISKLSKYKKLINQVVGSILKLLESSIKKDLMTVQSLYESFNYNWDSFDTKEGDQIRMKNFFSYMFKIKLIKMQTPLLTVCDYFFKRTAQPTNSTKNQQYRCYISCRNRIVYEVLEQFILQLKSHKVQIQHLKAIALNCEAQIQAERLQFHTAEVKSIHNIASKIILDIQNIKDFLSNYLNINTFFLHKCSFSDEKKNREIFEHISKNIQKIKNILSICDKQETLVCEIDKKLQQNKFLQVLSNFIFLQCFYPTQFFYFKFQKSQGKILVDLSAFNEQLKFQVLVLLKRNQLNLVQIDQIFKMASYQHLKLFLETSWVNHLSQKSRVSLLYFNELKPPTFKLKNFVETTLFFKIQIFKQCFRKQLNDKLMKLVEIYDQLIEQSIKIPYKLNKLSLLCKVYNSITNIYETIHNEFAFKYYQKIIQYSKYIKLFKIIFDLNFNQKMTFIQKVESFIQQKNNQKKHLDELQKSRKLKTFLSVLEKCFNIKYSPFPFKLFLTECILKIQQLQQCEQILQIIVQIQRKFLTESLNQQQIQYQQLIKRVLSQSDSEPESNFSTEEAIYKNKILKIDDKNVDEMRKISQFYHISSILESSIKNSPAQIDQISKQALEKILVHPNKKTRLKDQKKVKHHLSQIMQHEETLTANQRNFSEYKINEQQQSSIKYEELTISKELEERPVLQWLKYVTIQYSFSLQRSQMIKEKQERFCQQKLLQNKQSEQKQHLSSEFILAKFKQFFNQNYLDKEQLQASQKSNKSEIEFHYPQFKNTLLKKYPDILQPQNNKETFYLFVYTLFQMICYNLINYQKITVSEDPLRLVYDIITIEIVFIRNAILDKVFNQYDNNYTKALDKDHEIAQLLTYNNRISRPKIYSNAKLNQYQIVFNKMILKK